MRDVTKIIAEMKKRGMDVPAYLNEIEKGQQSIKDLCADYAFPEEEAWPIYWRHHNGSVKYPSFDAFFEAVKSDILVAISSRPKM